MIPKMRAMRFSTDGSHEAVMALRRRQRLHAQAQLERRLDELNGTGKWLLSWALTALQPGCLVRRELLHYGPTAEAADAYVRALR